MMNFPELEIQNFLAITHAKISLADRGLVLIQGENKADTSADSNGAGKSSIADALCWCWFGTTARGASGDDVINDEAKKDCFVRSTMQDGHVTYTATRHRKHKTGKNTFTLKSFDGVKEVDLTKGTDKLTQEVAQAIIGCSLDVFVGSIYSGQEQMPDLPAMTDKALKMLIEEAAGVTVLEAAYKKAREDAAEALAKVQAIVNERDRESHQLSFMRTQLAGLDTQIATWGADRDARLAAVKAQAPAVVTRLKELATSIAGMDGAAIEAGIKDCDAKIAAVSSERTHLDGLDLKVRFEHSALVTAKVNFDNAALHHSRCEAGLASVSHKVGCPCGECGRPMTAAELGAATKAAQDALDQAKLDLVDTKKAYDEAVDAHKAAQSVRDVYAAGMTDLSAVAAQRAVFQSELSSYQSLRAEQDRLQIQAKTIRDSIAAIGAEANPFVATKTALEGDIEKQERKIKDIGKRLAEAEADHALESEVVKIYAPAGVRAHILDDVTPFLNAQTAKYLSVLSDGNLEAIWTTLTPDSKGNLKEKFTIDVTNATGGKVFKLQSGGEKRKVRLATALALQDLVATRASKPIDLYIGDEIDHALDKSGLERLMMVLEDKARERGSVFVISHNELKDFIKQILVVEKLPNKTTRITEMAA